MKITTVLGRPRKILPMIVGLLEMNSRHQRVVSPTGGRG